ncbi:MAG: hemin uptake protein HemP [Pseudooceanicola sp.]
MMSASKLARTANGPLQAPLHQAGALMDGGTLARIEHEGQVYTLRITRAGKLILTK